MSIKNSSDTIGNQTHDLPTRSAVPQLTAPPVTPQQSFLIIFTDRNLKAKPYVPYIDCRVIVQSNGGTRFSLLTLSIGLYKDYSYCTKNTVRFTWKDELIIAAWRNNGCSFYENHTECINTTCGRIQRF